MDGIIDRLQIIRDDKSATGSSRPHVVIIGAGFGGLFAAMQLTHVAADVTVIDRRNHHLMPVTVPKVTSALACRERMPRIGAAISAGDRAAVATW